MRHTKDVLANALREAALASGGAASVAGSRLLAMADQAATGYYHDFLSPLDFPELQLAADLAGVGTPAAMKLRVRHINGEFDANKEESDAWADSPEGRDAFSQLVRGR